LGIFHGDFESVAPASEIVHSPGEVFHAPGESANDFSQLLQQLVKRH